MLPTLLQKGYISPNVITINYILENLKNEKILILKADTGSGKSTILPAHIYKSGISKKILSIQPRVFNAISLPYQIIKHDKSFKMGENIGYQTGTFQFIPKTGIQFVTFGVFTQILNGITDEELCKNYDTIIVDEAHEMDSTSVNVHLFLKTFFKRCKSNCPRLIITSATFDHLHFAKYYETKNIIEVKGFAHKITEHFLKYTSSNFLDTTVTTILEIHKINEPGDILVFVSGQMEMNVIHKKLLVHLDKFKNKPLLILNVNRDAIEKKTENFVNIFKSHEELGIYRKLIISTNVAETGITFPFLKYVIDTGFSKVSEYLADFDIKSLKDKPISYNSYLQRRGRIGRESAGDFYGIYTEKSKNLLKREISSKIYTDEMTIPILQLIHDGNLFGDLIYEINAYSIWRALDKLYLLGFINADITPTVLSELRNIQFLNIEGIKMIISGFYWQAPVIDLILIAIYMNNYNDMQFDTIFSNEAQCDFIPIVEEIHHFMKTGICKNKMQMINLLEMRDAVIDALAVAGFNPYKFYEKRFPYFDNVDSYYKLIKQCMYEGYKLNCATWNENKFTTVSGLDLYEKNPCGHKNFIFNDITLMTRGFDVNKKIKGKSILDTYINITQDFF